MLLVERDVLTRILCIKKYPCADWEIAKCMQIPVINRGFYDGKFTL